MKAVVPVMYVMTPGMNFKVYQEDWYHTDNTSDLCHFKEWQDVIVKTFKEREANPFTRDGKKGIVANVINIKAGNVEETQKALLSGYRCAAEKYKAFPKE